MVSDLRMDWGTKLWTHEIRKKHQSLVNQQQKELFSLDNQIPKAGSTRVALLGLLQNPKNPSTIPNIRETIPQLGLEASPKYIPPCARPSAMAATPPPLHIVSPPKG